MPSSKCKNKSKILKIKMAIIIKLQAVGRPEKDFYRPFQNISRKKCKTTNKWCSLKKNLSTTSGSFVYWLPTWSKLSADGDSIWTSSYSTQICPRNGWELHRDQSTTSMDKNTNKISFCTSSTIISLYCLLLLRAVLEWEPKTIRSYFLLS